MSLPHGAMGWSAVYNSDFSWSHSLFEGQEDRSVTDGNLNSYVTSCHKQVFGIFKAFYLVGGALS